jgi:GT2 family glycosyltransferase
MQKGIKMNQVTVIIPNFNGRAFLEGCLESLYHQSIKGFDIIVVDNASSDDSISYMASHYPEVSVVSMHKNYGFCKAVNVGIKRAKTPYIILLNNDMKVDTHFVEEMLKGIQSSGRIFSCQAKMLQMYHPELMDDGGDYYNGLGWAFAVGKGKPELRYSTKRKIFSSCAGAAIYKKSVLEELGYFDENHFAYLEDIDIGYRAKIHGYENIYYPSATVFHAGSGTTGSRYNDFKIFYSARNNVYLIYKNMPFLQLVLNFPFIFVGFMIKLFFFSTKKYARQYAKGIVAGIVLCKKGKKMSKKVKFEIKNLRNYMRIQWELWVNIGKKFSD